MNGLLSLVIAYLIGSVPFGFLLVKLTTGKDVRSGGSGNIGATNVIRITGRVAAVATLLLDIAKGFLAVWITAQMTASQGSADVVEWTAMAALAVMAGHAFPIFLKFDGGKAVASFIGAFLYLAPLPLLAVLIVFLIAVIATRHISAGSVLAANVSAGREHGSSGDMPRRNDGDQKNDKDSEQRERREIQKRADETGDSFAAIELQKDGERMTGHHGEGGHGGPIHDIGGPLGRGHLRRDPHGQVAFGHIEKQGRDRGPAGRWPQHNGRAV